MELWIGILGFVTLVAVFGSKRRVTVRQRRSIRGMLDDSRPCAVRPRP